MSSTTTDWCYRVILGKARCLRKRATEVTTAGVARPRLPARGDRRRRRQRAACRTGPGHAGSALPRRRLSCPANGPIAGHVFGEPGVRNHRRRGRPRAEEGPAEVAGPTRTERRREARPRQPGGSPSGRLGRRCGMLLAWLREDVLSLAGPDHATRRELFDFIVAELQSRESLCSHRIGPVVRALANQRDDLLAFAAGLDRDLEVLAAEFQVATETARDVLNVEQLVKIYISQLMQLV